MVEGETVMDERTDLLELLERQRGFLRYTVRHLTEEQANRRTTVSEFTLAGLIKHVSSVERGWGQFILDGSGMAFPADADWDEIAAWWQRENTVQPGDTLELLLQSYAEVAQRTEEIVRGVQDLGFVRLLPEAPWNTEDSWSIRRVVLHMIAETAQHSGHADIIRESFDGQKTMG